MQIKLLLERYIDYVHKLSRNNQDLHGFCEFMYLIRTKQCPLNEFFIFV